jgi:hypothetical protein
MKRLIPCLIVLAFLLGILGAKTTRAHVNRQICASSQGCPQISVFLPCVEFSTKGDTAENLPLLPGNYVFAGKPCGLNLVPGDWQSLTSQKPFASLGSGCGGLPS